MSVKNVALFIKAGYFSFYTAAAEGNFQNRNVPSEIGKCSMFFDVFFSLTISKLEASEKIQKCYIGYDTVL